jgi:nitrate/nitrite transporter NarK
MNRWWLLGCGVVLTLWVLVALLVLLFGLTFGSIYQFHAGAMMLALAVAAPSALRLVRSSFLRRFGAADIFTIVSLLVAVALFVWSNQQLGSLQPWHP